jgi:hypothetical protein
MKSLDGFRSMLHDGNTAQAFTDYELDFNSEAFDIFGDVPVKGYETHIEWRFEKPDLIKMYKATAEVGTKIYYLPWASKGVTSVTLDGDSPAYFLTSHLSNCRFTIKYHDGEGKMVTVMHVAGDVVGGAGTKGSEARDQLESNVKLPSAEIRARRLSVGGQKSLGKIGRTHMEEKANVGTTYYDSFARVFGARKSNGGWVFYVQNINHKNKIIGFREL